MDQRVRKMARLLIEYSTKVKKGDNVDIHGSPASKDLILALEEEVIKKGAYPITRVSLPGQQCLFYKYASQEQLKYFPEWRMDITKRLQATIGILDDVNTKELTSVDSKKLALRRKVTWPIAEYIMDPKNKINWTVTLFPTNAYAQDAEMSLEEFEDFVFSALLLDKDDPTKEWKKLSQKQQELTDMLTNAKAVKIIGKETDLTMSIEGRTAVNSDGRKNMPSGEVFTGPVEESVNGRILFHAFPVIYHGKEVKGIRIEFKDGKVVKASAEKNNDLLQEMLAIDEGAKRVGELGIGTNFGIKRFIRQILFDEKIGGTIHIALGKGYEECGSKNKSSIHWDMIMDLGKEGELFVDGRKLVRKGNTLAFE